MNSSFQMAMTVSELEIDRDEVHCNVEYRDLSRCLDVEENLGAFAQQMNRKCAVSLGRQNSINTQLRIVISNITMKSGDVRCLRTKINLTLLSTC